jgi:AcrR family transcriptional regulator
VFQSSTVDERSRRIVATAIDLAEKGGFEAVRLRDVAAHAGVALGTLYRHFRSKEDLLVAALTLEVERLEQRMTAQPAVGTSPLDRLCSLFATATHGLCRRPMLARAILRATASGQPELTEKVASFHGRMTDLIMRAIGQNGHPTQAAHSNRAIGLVLQQVWFASLVGWGGGLHDERAVTEQVRTAAGLVLAGTWDQLPEGGGLGRASG